MKIEPKIGITGVQGAGKTYVIKKVIELLKAEDWIIGGMITESEYKNDVLQRLVIIDIMSGEKGVFASKDIESSCVYEDLGVDISVLETLGVDAINRAIKEAELIVIDEIGKIELESNKFKDAINQALKCNKKLLITLHKKSRAIMLQEIRRRDDVRILEVTPINRSIIPFRIVKYLKEEYI